MRRIQSNRYRVSSRTHVEHLKGWIKAAAREEATGTTNCLNVVELVYTVFREGLMEEETTWKTVVLIPKVTVDFWGIGLVEVL